MTNDETARFGRYLTGQPDPEPEETEEEKEERLKNGNVVPSEGRRSTSPTTNDKRRFANFLIGRRTY